MSSSIVNHPLIISLDHLRVGDSNDFDGLFITPTLFDFPDSGILNAGTATSSTKRFPTMTTQICTYLFKLTCCVCLANVYVDSNMQTGILGHLLTFNRVVRMLASAPGILRALPSTFLLRIAAFYRQWTVDLVAEQKQIQNLGYEQALVEKKRYEKGLRQLGSLDPDIQRAKPVEKELFLAVIELVGKLRENIFLMDLIINHELEPDDQLADLLEDYYDGLLVEERKDEERFPWEQVKAELDAKHKQG